MARVLNLSPWARRDLARTGTARADLEARIPEGLRVSVSARRPLGPYIAHLNARRVEAPTAEGAVLKLLEEVASEA